MDVRLYHKAKSVAEPFAYAEYRKNKIREKIEEQRKSRVQVCMRVTEITARGGFVDAFAANSSQFELIHFNP